MERSDPEPKGSILIFLLPSLRDTYLADTPAERYYLLTNLFTTRTIVELLHQNNYQNAFHIGDRLLVSAISSAILTHAFLQL